ncbi:MAG: hypothetical protein ABIL01_20620 [Pseudomonadota bacterium]
MTDYYGLVRGRRATTDARLGQVLSWLRDVRPEAPSLTGRGDYFDAWRHGGTAALLAYHHGYDNVRRWGDALEDYRPDNEQEYRQDIRNNEVGAKIGALARLTGMTVSELGDAVKAAFKAGAFQTDAYAPFSGSPTFRVGDMTASVGSGIVTLPDGARFDLTKSAVISDGGLEYPLLSVIRKDGSVQENWTNMEDSRTLFRGGTGKWEPPQSSDTPAASFNDRFATVPPRTSVAAGPLQQDRWLSRSLAGPLTAPSLTSSMFSPRPIANSFPAFGGAADTGNITQLNQTASAPWYSSPAVTGNYTPTENFSWNTVPGGLGGAPSPVPRGPQQDRRSAAPDRSAPTSAQGALPATPASDEGVAGTGGVLGKFIWDGLIAPAEAASPSAQEVPPRAPYSPSPESTFVDRWGNAPSPDGYPKLGVSSVFPSITPPDLEQQPPEHSRLPGIVSGKPMPLLSTPLPLGELLNSSTPSDEDWLKGLAGLALRNSTQSEPPQQTAGSVPERSLGRKTYGVSRASVFDAGAPAVPFVSSNDTDYSGGQLGRFAALTGLDPQNPDQPASLPLDDDEEQPDLRALEAAFSGSGNIRDAMALHKARRSSRS